MGQPAQLDAGGIDRTTARTFLDLYPPVAVRRGTEGKRILNARLRFKTEVLNRPFLAEDPIGIQIRP